MGGNSPSPCSRAGSHAAGSSGRRGALKEQMQCTRGAEVISRRAYAAATPLVGAVAMVGYLRFGNNVAGNLLTSLSADGNSHEVGLLDKAFMLATSTYGIVLVAASAFVAAPCRTAALELFLVRRSAGGASTKTFRRATGAVLAACAVTAWFVRDLASLIGFLGAWAAGPLVFILPALIIVELARQEDGRPILSASNAVPIALLLFGATLILSSTAGFLSIALTYPAGHRGQRVMMHNLNYITVGNITGPPL